MKLPLIFMIVLNIAIKMSVGIYILHVFHHKKSRKSLLIWAFAWFFAAFSILFDIIEIHHLNAIFRALSASLFFFGVLILISEEAFYFQTNILYLLAFAPFLLASYVVAITKTGSISEWTITIGVSYGISGIYMISSGILMLPFSKVYKQRAKLLAVSFILYGIHIVDYTFLRKVSWFAPMGFLIGTTLTIMIAYSMIKFVRAGQFQKIPEKEKPKMLAEELESGILIIDEKKYKEIREMLQDTNVLLLSRDLSNVPERWDIYFITHITGRNIRAISPTNLARIVELINRYLRHMKEMKQKGIIIIDCLEYLIMYNSFEAVAKFLSSIRDYIMMYEGTLILVTNPSVWSEKEWALLKRLLS